MLSASIWGEWQTQAVNILNAMLALAAGCAHIWAALNTRGWLRRMFIIIAAMAWFYCVAYMWLVFHADRVEDWSNVIRPFGIMSWVMAWCIEPILLVRYFRNSARRLHEAGVTAIREVEEKTGVSLDE